MGTYDTIGGTPRHDPMFDCDPPCDVCGKHVHECRCPPCLVCGLDKLVFVLDNKEAVNVFIEALERGKQILERERERECQR